MRLYRVVRAELTEFVTEIWADSHGHAEALAQGMDPEDGWVSDGFYVDYVVLSMSDEEGDDDDD